MADSKNNVTIHITGANPHIYPTAATVINYFGDKFAEDSIKNNQRGVIPNMEEEGKKDDPLRMFLQNDEDYDYVLEWARLCKSPKDIYNSIVLPLKKKGYGLEITTNPPFLKELIPHLTNFVTSMNVESISRALRR